MPYTFTLPVGGGTLTVTADTLDELVAAASVADLTRLSSLAPVRTAPAAPAATPTPAQPGPAPTCVHGTRVHRTGTSTRGPWAAWMCPLPKDRKPEQCEPVWIDTRQPAPAVHADAAPF